jgi:hypothetical protein
MFWANHAVQCSPSNHNLINFTGGFSYRGKMVMRQRRSQSAPTRRLSRTRGFARFNSSRMTSGSAARMSVIHYRIRFAHPLRSLATGCRKQVALYRMSRRAGVQRKLEGGAVASAEVQRLSTAQCYADYGNARWVRGFEAGGAKTSSALRV